MPGILGIVSKRPLAEQSQMMDVMRQTMVHEPFHRSGACNNTDPRCSIGWVTEENSFSDCLPVWNEEKSVCLIFSGEHFPGTDERARLKSKGHIFNARDASYLVHLYEEQEEGFFESLNGLFSGVLVDLRRKQVIVFNDRYGMNRLYFHEREDGFYFASEAKALLKVLPELRQLDLRSASEFFSCGCVLQGRTFFQRIGQIPGGSAWVISGEGRVEKKSYFQKEKWEAQETLAPGEYYEELRDTWKKILPRYLNGAAPVALSLTGGLDSRLILAWAPKLTGKIPCYTFGGMYRDCVDLEMARKVARICGQSHQTIPLDDAFLEDFPALVQKTAYVTDGVLDPTGAADLYVQRQARKIAPVRVSGLYGGEILRNLLVFKPSTLGQGLVTESFAKLAGETANTYRQELQGRQLSFIAFKQAPWFIYSRLAIERSQLTLRSPYFDNDLIRLAFQAPPELSSSKDLGLRLIADGNPDLRSVETDRGLTLQTVPGLTHLHHLFQEFTFKAEYAYDYGMPQWLARADSMVKPLHLEKLFLGRHKFYHYRLWYRDALSGFLKQVLLDARAKQRSYIGGEVIEKMVIQHTRGVANYTTEIHRLLSLELMQRALLDN